MIFFFLRVFKQTIVVDLTYLNKYVIEPLLFAIIFN